MPSIGPLFPSTITTESGAGLTNWTNPNNAKVSDNVYTTVSSGISNTAHTYYLEATGFDFSAIPSSAQIIGATASVEGKGSSCSDYAAQWIVGGTRTGTDLSSGTSWGTSDSTHTFTLAGSGLTLTGSDVNGANFGFAYAALISGQGKTVSVDSVSITVTYQLATQTLTATGVASAEAFGSAGLLTPFASISELYDDFGDNTDDPAKWAAWTSGTAARAETNHTLTVTPVANQGGYGGLNSVSRINLTGRRASVQLLQELNTGSSESDLWLYLDANNKAGIQVTGSVLQAYLDVGGTESWTGGVTYDATVHRYLGISEAGGTLTWEYSTNGSSWTSLKSQANPFAVTSLEYRIFAGVWDTSNSSPGTAIFDNVNLVPSATRQLISVSIASAEALGTATVTTQVSLSPTGIASGETFGNAALQTAGSISPAGIASGEVFGTAIITPGGITLTPTSIGSGEAFGVVVFSTISTFLPAGIDSAETFGSATVTIGAVHLQPTGITSAETFGVATVGVGLLSLFPTGLVSEESFGTTTVLPGTITLTPTGIGSTEVFGIVSLSVKVHLHSGLDVWIYVKEPTLLMALWLMEDDDE